MLALILAVAVAVPPLKEYWVVDVSKMTPAERALVQSIQGLANRNGPFVWQDVGGMSTVLIDRLKAMNWKERRTSDWRSLVRVYGSALKGGVRCRVEDESLNRAATLAGHDDLLVVDKSLESAVKDEGIRIVGDTTNLVAPPPELSKNLAVEQPPEKAGFLRDFAIKHRALCYWSGSDSADRKANLEELIPGAWIVGWGPDEYAWISDISRLGGIGVAADWCANLSAMESLRSTITSPKPPKKEPEPKKGERIVAFVLSDGDNVQWLTGGMPLEDRYYGNKLRGTFKMTWEVSPLLAKLAPAVLDYMFKQATPMDGFVAAGAPGYSYAELAPNRAVAARQTGPLLKSSGLGTVGIIDAQGGKLSNAKEILELPEVDGVVYKDYSPYHGKHGAIWWHKGKPCVGYRYSLWEGLAGGAPEEIAAAVAKLPADPANPDSYALVTVHAWSFGSSGGPIDAIKRTIALLPPGTRVVTAPELIAWLKKFAGPGRE